MIFNGTSYMKSYIFHQMISNEDSFFAAVDKNLISDKNDYFKRNFVVKVKNIHFEIHPISDK